MAEVRGGAPDRSLGWYIPILIVLATGYAMGAAFAFGTAFLGWWPVTDPAGQLCLELYGMGMLGATLYCSKWWSLDHEQALDDESVRPTGF